jgi:hypothetical protein
MRDAVKTRTAPTLYALGLTMLAISVSLIMIESYEYFKHTHDIADAIGSRLKLTAAETKIFQVGLIWFSSMLILYCFYLKEGTTIWRHVARNKCFNVERYPWALTLCAAPRVALTLLSAPVVIALGLIKALSSGSELVQVGFVTLNPHFLFSMTKHLASAIIIICGLFGVLHTVSTKNATSHYTLPSK